MIPPPFARRLVQLIAFGRILFGAAAVAAPQVVIRPWIGDRRRDSGTLLLARALGIRDMALGLGAVLALRRDRPVRGWVEAAGLADAGDAAFTLLGFSKLPERSRVWIAGAAAATAAAGFVSAPAVDRA